MRGVCSFVLCFLAVVVVSGCASGNCESKPQSKAVVFTLTGPFADFHVADVVRDGDEAPVDTGDVDVEVGGGFGVIVAIGEAGGSVVDLRGIDGNGRYNVTLGAVSLSFTGLDGGTSREGTFEIEGVDSGGYVEGSYDVIFEGDAAVQGTFLLEENDGDGDCV